ncbi:MAG: UDP-N-acetylmuramate dehydrogenase [Acidobacteria bacterium]|nr:UDP-N-acetylmuramate dehydrogenase [Acidobacteriota bacterium]
MTDIGDMLRTALPGVAVTANAPLGPLTTFKVGGLADWLVEPGSGDDLVRVLQLVQQHGLPLTMLGGGSNVLIADEGVRGVVVRPRGGVLQRVGPDIVRADAAVTINGLVRWTIGRGLAALEAWAGTPGTVGGAIYGNAHWRQANVGDVVESVRVMTRDGGLRQVPADRLGFDYDTSRLQQSGEILIWAAFRVQPNHDPEALRAVARASLAFRKQTQPLASPSAGCIFQNPQSPRDTLPEGMPASAGALVDRAGLKGRAIGGARVSDAHANFIVNDGTATAHDVAALIELCRATVAERFGVTLRDEIVRLGAWLERG